MRAFSMVFLLSLSISSCSFSGLSLTSVLMGSAWASWSNPSNPTGAHKDLKIRCGFEINPHDEASSEAQATFLKKVDGLWRNNLDGAVMELDRDGRSSLSQDGVSIDAKSQQFNFESIAVATQKTSGDTDRFEVLSHKVLAPGRIVYVSREDRQGFRFLIVQSNPIQGSIEGQTKCTAYELKIGTQAEGEPAVFLRGPIPDPSSAPAQNLAVRDPAQFSSQLFTR